MPADKGCVTDRVKVTLTQCPKSKQAGDYGLKLIEFYGTSNDTETEVEEATPTQPTSTPKLTGKNKRIFWKYFKNSIDQFCTTMNLQEFEKMPDLSRGGFFLEAFEMAPISTHSV